MTTEIQLNYFPGISEVEIGQSTLGSPNLNLKRKNIANCFLLISLFQQDSSAAGRASCPVADAMWKTVAVAAVAVRCGASLPHNPWVGSHLAASAGSAQGSDITLAMAVSAVPGNKV